MASKARVSRSDETTAVARAVTLADHNATAIVEIDPERLFRAQRAREPTMVLRETLDRRAKRGRRDTTPWHRTRPRTASLIGFLGMIWLGTVCVAMASVWIWDRFFAG